MMRRKKVGRLKMVAGSGGRVDAAARADLETQMRQLSSQEGSVYLPNIVPTSKVKTVLIGMEPLLGRWAPTH